MLQNESLYGENRTDKASPASAETETNDNFMRGCTFAVAMSVPLWAALAWAIQHT